MNVSADVDLIGWNPSWLWNNCPLSCPDAEVER
jgi:hypothetical protein